MKKYVLVISAVLFIFFGIYYAIMGMGFYIDFWPNAVTTVPFRSDGKQLMYQTEDGTYETFILRGVDISSGIAGHYATQFFAADEDYLRWFGYIGDMGANSLRVTTVMDSDFYNALHKYNTTHTKPLYLIQGISISDYANNNTNDAYGSGFYDSLIKDGKNLVDIIHGKKVVFSLSNGGDVYFRDVSPWVIGYLVGSEWVSDTIAYTDNNNLRADNFQGEYFYTSSESTAFEAMLAQVMESITSYETKKYKTQRLVGFVSDPSNDFLEYEDVYAKQLFKHTQLDAEHVFPTELMQAGSFAAYRLYYFCSDFVNYLSADKKTELAPLLCGLNYDGIYDGYLDLLAKYHSMPVIATGYGYSSSRGAVRMDVPPLTEREQGENLVAFSRELETDGWAGGFISSWQDAWERRTWNTAFSALTGRNYLWHDLQTDGQGYGLMAFDPGSDGRVCVLDGADDEWDTSDLVHENNGISVYAKYDEEGLFLLVRKAELTSNDVLYFPFDISPKTGSYTCEQPVLTFTRASDFLLVLSGENETRLLVQERYDAARQRFLAEITGENPFINIPGKESPVFSPVIMALENTLIFDEITPETRVLQRSKAWETGRLTHGNGDPSSPNYNSLTDFCYGEDLVEIRLPWSLLNFYDPSFMQIHDDYYEKYGVEGILVKRIYIGAGAAGANEPINMSPITLKGWNLAVSFHERMKQSFYIIKESWAAFE